MSLVSQVSSLATRISTEIKAVRTVMGALSSLTTADKTSLVAAINEVKAATAAASGIADGVTAGGTTWSSSKINTAINAATAALVASSPAALDTLNELAAAMGNDANFATTTANALGNRLRVDASQTLSAAQKTQGQTNLGVPSTADVGDTTTNFVDVFNAGLL
jgi:hypothetical protein